MSIGELKTAVKREVVKALNDHRQEINGSRAEEIASYVLSSLDDITSFTELVKTVENFDNQYPELQSVVIYITKLYNDSLTQETLDKVDRLIHEQKIEEAEQLLDDTLKNEHEAGSTISTQQYITPQATKTTDKDPGETLSEIANVPKIKENNLADK